MRDEAPDFLGLEDVLELHALGVGDITARLCDKASTAARPVPARPSAVAQTSPYPVAEPGFALSGLSLPSGAARSG